MARVTKDPADIHVGQRLRLRRNKVGMSQEKLAGAVGISFQQIQKYENGTNRMSAGRLRQMSQILEVPFSFFFDGLAGHKIERVAEELPGGLDEQILTQKESVTLLAIYYKLAEEQRVEVLDFMKKLVSKSR